MWFRFMEHGLLTKARRVPHHCLWVWAHGSEFKDELRVWVWVWTKSKVCWSSGASLMFWCLLWADIEASLLFVEADLWSRVHVKLRLNLCLYFHHWKGKKIWTTEMFLTPLVIGNYEVRILSLPFVIEFDFSGGNLSGKNRASRWHSPMD